MSPWPNLFKPSLRGPVTFLQAGDSGHLLPQHLPASSFPILGYFLTLCPPRCSLRFFCAVCMYADPILLPTPVVGAWASAWCCPLAEQCYCQGPTTEGLWQLLSPRQSGLAAGWKWPRSALLCFHIKQRCGNYSLRCLEGKKKKRELISEFHPPLILFSKFMEESCSSSQGNSASLTDWHCLCWNWVLKKQISLQRKCISIYKKQQKE